MTTEQLGYDSDLSAEYLRKARAHFMAGDLTQASEKGWGAAAVAVKAVAESRGWPHERHRDSWNIVRQLVRETGDSDLRLTFGDAQTMHINCYEAAMESDDIEQYLDEVERLVGKLGALA